MYWFKGNELCYKCYYFRTVGNIGFFYNLLRNTDVWSELIILYRTYHVIRNCVILHQPKCSEANNCITRMENYSNSTVLLKSSLLRTRDSDENTQCGKVEKCANSLCGKIQIGRRVLLCQYTLKIHCDGDN